MTDAEPLELRPSLRPPRIDEAEFARLLELGREVASAHPSTAEAEHAVEAFATAASVSQADIGLVDWLEHGSIEQWVRSVVWRRDLHLDPDLTEDEMVEVIRRMHDGPDPDWYREVFLANDRYRGREDPAEFLRPSLGREPTDRDLARFALQDQAIRLGPPG